MKASYALYLPRRREKGRPGRHLTRYYRPNTHLSVVSYTRPSELPGQVLRGPPAFENYYPLPAVADTPDYRQQACQGERGCRNSLQAMADMGHWLCLSRSHKMVRPVQGVFLGRPRLARVAGCGGNRPRSAVGGLDGPGPARRR